MKPSIHFKPSQLIGCIIEDLKRQWDPNIPLTQDQYQYMKLQAVIQYLHEEAKNLVSCKMEKEWEEEDLLKELYSDKTFDYKVYRDSVREMQTCKSSSKMFLEKMREFEELYREEKCYLSKLYKRRGTSLSKSLFGINNLIDIVSTRADKYQKEYNKFSFYHALALGKATTQDFDLDLLKNIDPKLLLHDPLMETSQLLQYKCPLHNEKTPSFMWYKKTQSFYCFGCSVHGDIIDLYQKLNSCNFITACKELKALI